MKKDYYPHSEASIIQWNENFATQLADVGSTLGFTPEEVTAITATCTTIETAITNLEIQKAKIKEQTSEKNITLDTGVNDIRDFVKRIKVAPSYTPALGKLLGIVADTSSFDPSTAVPIIKLSKTGSGYDFSFSLHGYFNAVSVFKRVPGEDDFSQVGIDMKSPYSIEPPAVSGCEFYFQYLKNDNLIGLKSDIIVVEL